MKNVAYFIVAMICAAAAGLLQAHVATELWLWFVVPLGAITINLWHAWGLLFLWSCTKGPSMNAKRDEPGEVWERTFGRILASVFVSLVCWGCGALLRGHI